MVQSFCYADVAELADALDLGSSGRPWGFESLHPHQALELQDSRAFFVPKIAINKVSFDINVTSTGKIGAQIHLEKGI